MSNNILLFKFILLLLFLSTISNSAFGVRGTSYASKLNSEDFKPPNDSKNSATVRKSDLWQLISEPGTTPVIYYAPFSVRKVKPGFASVTSLINYTSDEGNAESLLGVTLYNCASATKQEQSTVQYSMHWADGDVKLRIGFEEPWELVKVGTEGMRLLKVACDQR